MEDIKSIIRDPSSMMTYIIMHLLICGLLTNLVGGYWLYKEFVLGQKAIMVGSLDSLEQGDKEKIEFERGKRR